MNALDYFYSLPYEERSRIRMLAQQALDAYNMDAEDDDPPRNINDYLSDNAGGWLAKYLNENKKGWDAEDSDGDTGPTKIASFGDFVNTGATAGSPGFETWTGVEGSDYEGLSRNFRVGTSETNIEDSFDDWAQSSEGARQRMLYMREQAPEGAEARDKKIKETTERLRLEAEAKAKAEAEAAAAGDDDDKKPKYDLAYQRANGVDETGRRLTYAEYFDKFGGDPPPGGWESKYGENGDWLPDKLPEDAAAAAAAAGDDDGDDGPQGTDPDELRESTYNFAEVEAQARSDAIAYMGTTWKKSPSLGRTGDMRFVPANWLELIKLETVDANIKAFWYSTVVQDRSLQIQKEKKARELNLKNVETQKRNYLAEEWDNQSRQFRDTAANQVVHKAKLKEFDDQILGLNNDVRVYDDLLAGLNKRITKSQTAYENAFLNNTFSLTSDEIDLDVNWWSPESVSKYLENDKIFTTPPVGKKGGDFTDPLTDVPTDVTEAQKAEAAAVAEQQRQPGPASAEGETFEERMARLAGATTPMGLQQLQSELYGLQSPFQQFTRLGATGEFLTDAAGNPIQTPQLSQFGQQGVQDYFNRFIEPRYALELAQASQQALGGLAPQFQPGFEEFARGAPSLGRLSGEQLRAQQADLLATLQDRTRTTDPYRQELLSYLGDLEDPTNKRLIGALAAPTLGQMSPYFRSDARDRIAQQLTYAMLAQPERSLLSLFADTPVSQGFQDYLSPAGQKAVSSFTPGGLGG